jgi:hypothetical protein
MINGREALTKAVIADNKEPFILAENLQRLRQR